MNCGRRQPAALFDSALKLAPLLDLKPWGGQRLAAWGKSLPGEPVGEALESGNASRVVGGTHHGATLGELTRAFPHELLGPRARAAAGPALDFPLLVKLIDARETLSVQLHPSDAQAPPGKRGKCEAWLVLEALPGAELIVGLRGELAPDKLEKQLARRPARVGDVYLIPPGVVHAIGAGVLLYEVQQPSDVTYRVYDWGRPRELHLADCLRLARSDGEALALAPLRWGAQRELLVACRYFALERRDVSGVGSIEAMPASCRVLTVLAGALRIGSVELSMGGSAVLPASMSAQRVTGTATVLLAWVPELEDAVVPAMRAAGMSTAQIAAFTGAGMLD